MLGWTLLTAIRMPAHARRWQHRQDELRELAAMQDRLATWDDMANRLEESLPSPTTDLRSLIRDQFPGLRIDVQPESTENAWQGWQVERVQVRMDSVPTDSIGALLTLLESRRPPWRLTRIQLDASETEFDQARIRMSLERLRLE